MSSQLLLLQPDAPRAFRSGRLSLTTWWRAALPPPATTAPPPAAMPTVGGAAPRVFDGVLAEEDRRRLAATRPVRWALYDRHAADPRNAQAHARAAARRPAAPVAMACPAPDFACRSEPQPCTFRCLPPLARSAPSSRCSARSATPHATSSTGAARGGMVSPATATATRPARSRRDLAAISVRSRCDLPAISLRSRCNLPATSRRARRAHRPRRTCSTSTRGRGWPARPCCTARGQCAWRTRTTSPRTTSPSSERRGTTSPGLACSRQVHGAGPGGETAPLRWQLGAWGAATGARVPG